MPDFIENPAYEIARRLELRGKDSYAWFVILRSPMSSRTVISDLLDEFEAFNVSATKIEVTGMLIDDLRAAVQASPEQTVILFGLDERTPEFWQMLDLNRSTFERPGAIVLWMGSGTVGTMCQYAPNVRSFVGGSIFQLGADHTSMSAEERSVRLQELRTFYGLSDEEVIQRAESRTLNPEPHFVEWLALLGKGDLI